ncbi:hypothetical protein IGI04_041007 [Brassica rapa subsp. trilocularis]|uniref:Uncharacterized protein n=1 Tax=Brassica rapa subsp. trilocularis TaxID=1813537 RepID=A0ABQ7KQR8_BRACM|nr:hypothetical protein IGI04_041007 [Brassica rapa subsp. trilocularis]
MPSIFFSFENDIFTLSPSSSSSNYKVAIVINTLTTMNNQFEALNALNSTHFNSWYKVAIVINTLTTMNNQFEALNAPKIEVIEANDYGWVTFFEIMCACRSLMCAKETTYMGSRLAVDDLPGSRLVNAEVIFAIDFEICFLRRLKVKSLTFPDDLHFSRLIISIQRQAWTPLDMEEDFVRRLQGSLADF